MTSSPPAGFALGVVWTLIVGTAGKSGIKVSDWPAAGVITEGRGNHWPPPPPTTGPADAAVYGGRFGAAALAYSHHYSNIVD